MGDTDDAPEEFDYIVLPENDDHVQDTIVADGPILEFRYIHNKPRPFDSDDRCIYLSGVGLEVKIEKYEYSPGGTIISPYLYHIQVKHGEFTWTIYKRYSHIIQLHEQLRLLRAKMRLRLPIRTHEERRKSFAQNKKKLAKIPRTPDSMLNEEDLPKRQKELEEYLQSVVSVPQYRNHHATVEFLEVSHLSFIRALGEKNCEGMVKKRAGGRRVGREAWCSCCGELSCCINWHDRWLIVKDNFVATMRPEDGRINEVLLMDGDFDVKSGFEATTLKEGLLISNMTRRLLVKCHNERQAKKFEDNIKAVADKATDFTQQSQNPNHSFAPNRSLSYASWFVDAATYMSAVADAMENAQEEIFITDWWFSPEIYMKRPMTEGNKWRLDVILQRKANEGIKVFVLVYKEMEMALGLNSFYSKKTLMSLHRNIKVMRHPDGINFWSHHEKSVIIDQRIAFLGGIDLCYGRWDTPEHRLTDTGSVYVPPPTAKEGGSQFYISDAGNTGDMEQRPSEGENTEIPEYDTAVASHSWPESSSEQQAYLERKVQKGKVLHHQHLKLDESITESADDVPNTLQTIPEGSTPYQVGLDIPEVTLEFQEDPAAQALEDLSHSDEVFTKSSVFTEKSMPTGGTDAGPAGSPEADVNNILDNSSRLLQYGDFVIRVPSFQTVDEPNLEELITPEDRQRSPAHNPSHFLSKDLFRRRVSGSEESQLEEAHQNEMHVSSEAKMDAHAMQNYGAMDTTDIGFNNNAMQKESGEITKSSVIQTQNGREPETLKDDHLSRATRLLQVTRMWRGTVDSSGNRNQLQRQPRLEGDERPNPIILHPSNLPSGDKPIQKPSTPPARSKFAQRAHEVRMKFRRAKSKSVDIETEVDDDDFNLFKSLRENAQDNPDSVLQGMGLTGSAKIWIGKDYTNFIFKDFVDLDKPFTDFIDRNVTPRMPWHDIGAVVYGKAARDVARHFIQRWNVTKTEKRKTHQDYPLLLPMAYHKIRVPRTVLHTAFPCECQILRSSCEWSAGMKHTEHSIHNAYLSCIENAKHYIYIENQFFVSVEGDGTVKNEIGTALFKRIKRAHDEGEAFKVYVMMPLLPAFEGELGTNRGLSIQAVIHWNYSSMCRGKQSLIGRLALAGVPDPLEYVSFYGLRNHSELMGKLTTELVYVHSKLMIVDDDTVIIGSANINDRSLIGTRDSELAVLVKDRKRFQSRMNGQEYQAGWFASTLRKHLFREHLGLLTRESIAKKIDVTDPVATSFYKDVWLKHASINTSVYEKVFRCLPTDSVRTFPELNAYQRLPRMANLNPTQAKQELARVQGHLVLMPLLFLDKENLQPGAVTKEGMVPTTIWT